MKSRRVSILCVPFIVALSQAVPQTVAAEPNGAGSAIEANAADDREALATTHAAIGAAVRGSKAIAMLDHYNPTAQNEVRFLIVVDRLATDDSLSPVDLLATRDGRLFLIGDTKEPSKSIRAATNRDLQKYDFTLDDATKGLKSAARRPVSLLVPKELVSAR